MMYRNSLAYLIGIFVVNYLFGYLPMYTIAGSAFSSGDLLVGVIYILRNFAQQEIGSKVIYVMLAGCALSYIFADPHVAIASTSSFVVGESIEWGIFTYTRLSFSQRLLTAAIVSVPVDSVIFLYLIHQLNMMGFIAFTAAKIVGIIIVWIYWRTTKQLKLSSATTA